MDRSRFVKLSTAALEHIDNVLGDLELDGIDVDLAGDVLTISFTDGTKFIINSHSAAGQIWMAADNAAWHFDYDETSQTWVAKKTGDELMQTVAKTVGHKLDTSISL
jgi:CyaY protein